MGAVLEFATQLKATDCFTCGIAFAFSATIYDRRLADRQTFYCPLGHAQHFIGETEAQRLKRELDLKGRSLAWQRERAENLENRLKAQRAATKRASNKLKRTKERVGHGVCPCCNRTFSQLARHMTAKHPDYAQSHEPGDLAAIEGHQS